MARICDRLALVLIALALLSVLRASIAHADDSAKARAATLLDEGVALFNANDHAAALERFRRAYEAFPSPKIHFNIAGALHKLGREVEAAEAYDRFITETASLSDVSEDRKTSAARSLAELEKRVGRLAIEAPKGASLALDARPIALREGRPVYVSPGKHHLAATAPGFVRKEQDLEIAAGESRRVSITLEPDTTVVKPPPPIPPVKTTTPSRSRRWMWAAGGAAGLAIGGSVFGLRARSDFAEYEETMSAARYDELRASIRRDSMVANVMFAGAGLAAIAAGVLFFIDGRSERAPRVGLTITPAGMAVGGRF